VTIRLDTIDGSIPIEDDFADDSHTTPVEVDFSALHAAQRAASRASAETAERLAQAAEVLPVLMTGAAWAQWVRSGRWAA